MKLSNQSLSVKVILNQQQQGSSSPFVPAIYTALGALIAAVITAINAFIIARRQDKANAQQHFRQYYITEGFEEALAQLMQLREHFIYRHSPYNVESDNFELSIKPFLRVYDVVGCKNIPTIVNTLRSLGQGFILDLPRKGIELTVIDETFEQLLRAKELLLKYSYNHKPDVKTLQKMKEMKEIRSALDTINQRGIDVFKERSKPGLF